MRRLIAAALAFLMVFGGSALAKGLKKKDIKDNWLVLNYGTAEKQNYKKVAEVADPEGFRPLEGVTPNTNGLETELYYVPTEASDIRFFYYTTGNGDSAALAERLPVMYASFYEDFTAGDIHTQNIGGHDWLIFTYSCCYPNQDETSNVYEHSAICYRQIIDSGYIACIISLQYGSAEAVPDQEALDPLIEQAINAIQFES